VGGARLAGALVVRPGRDAVRDHAVHDALRAARRAREADARQFDGAESRRVVDRVARRAGLRIRAPQGRPIPQRRCGDVRRREVLAGALPRRRRHHAEGSRRRRRRARSAARAHQTQAAVAGLHDVLRNAGDGRGLDRAQALRGARRRGRFQAGAGRRRAVPVRLLHAGCRARARGQRGLLAQDPGRQAADLPLGAGR
jgi:hypothetical protein